MSIVKRHWLSEGLLARLSPVMRGVFTAFFGRLDACKFADFTESNSYKLREK